MKTDSISRFFRSSIVCAVSASLLLGLAGGCCSSRVTNQGGHDICEVENSRFMLVGCIPLLSGDIDHPNENSCVAWQDTSTIANNLYLMDKEMARRHAKGRKNLVSYRTDENVFFAILKRSTLHTSAEFTK